MVCILGRQAAAWWSPICACQPPKMCSCVGPWTSAGQWVSDWWWWAALVGCFQRPRSVSVIVWMSLLSALSECEIDFLLLCIVRGLKGFVAFLAEQPRQLKHLEWPGLQNTVWPLHWTLLRCFGEFLLYTAKHNVIWCQYNFKKKWCQY